MPASLDPQLALDETAITDSDLEAALERHLRAKQDQAEAQGVVKSAMKDIERELAKHPPVTETSALRVGRFRLSIRHIEGSHREFDVEERDQLKIGLLGEDGAPVKRAYRRRNGGPAKDTTGDEAMEPRPPLRAVRDDDADLRPTGTVNADALRGDADRATLPN